MNEYQDIEASLLRFSADLAHELTQFGLEVSAEYVDAFGSPTEWPETDFIGPAEMRIDMDEGVIYVTLAIVVSTRQDTNLTKMSKIVNRVMNKLAKDARIVIFDAASGAPRGHLIVQDGTRVGIKLNTDTQPAKPIFINLVSDQILSRG